MLEEDFFQEFRNLKVPSRTVWSTCENSIITFRFPRPSKTSPKSERP